MLMLFLTVAMVHIVALMSPGPDMRKLERFGKPFMALIRAHVDGDDEE